MEERQKDRKEREREKKVNVERKLIHFVSGNL
jgi:hypothetical protein